MKTLFITALILLINLLGFAQSDTISTTTDDFNQLIENVDEIEEIDTLAIETLETSDVIITDKDTLQIRFGNHNVEIISDGDNTQIDVEKIENYESRWEKNDWDNEQVETMKKGKHKKGFDGHWAGFEFGGNMFRDLSYSTYPTETPDFMALRHEKSFEFNFNFAEYSFGFGSYVGIVTGLGFNFNDYKFRNRYTIEGVDGKIQPVALPEGDFRLSKLSTGYLTAPLMLEIQIPGNGGHDRMFIAGGLIGGVKMGEHTKTKIGSEKLKDKSDHFVSPVRWGYTARVGFEDMGIFATYYETGLFESGKGPDTHPVTIGLTFTF